MKTVKAYLKNCVIDGIEDNYTKLELNIKGLKIGLVQNKKYTYSFDKKDHFVGNQLDTTTLIFKDTNLSKEEIIKTSENISSLLSFVLLTPVRFYKLEGKFSYARTVSGDYTYSNPLFELANADDIKFFLENTYETYEELKEKRQLNIVIEYLITAQKNLPFEVKLATIFILLENLKKTFAEEEKFPYKDNSYKYKTNLNCTIGFKNLLIKMFDKIGLIGIDFTDIKKLRDELIHSGLSQTPLFDQEKVYNLSHDLIQEYLLKLLNYKGKYFKYSSRGTAYSILS